MLVEVNGKGVVGFLVVLDDFRVVVPADDFEFDLDRDLTDFGVTDLDRPDPEAGEPKRDGDSELERAELDLELAGERIGDELDC